MNARMFFSALVSLIVVLVSLLLSDPQVQTQISDILGFDPEFVRVEQPSVDPGKVEVAQVRRVVDGDTIQLEDGRSIRYLYIDTPETVHPTKPVMCFGPEASQINKAWVEGKQVQLVQDEDPTDRYGRDLRLVFLPGRDTGDPSQSINAELVRGGFARASIFRPNDTFEDDFLQYEQAAREANVGAWDACPDPFEE